MQMYTLTLSHIYRPWHGSIYLLTSFSLSPFLFLSLLPSISLAATLSLSLSERWRGCASRVYQSKRERERGKCGHTLSIPHSFSISHRNLIISMACVIIILTTKLKGSKEPIIPFKNIISRSLFLSLSPSSPIIERERGKEGKSCMHAFLFVSCMRKCGRAYGQI